MPWTTFSIIGLGILGRHSPDMSQMGSNHIVYAQLKWQWGCFLFQLRGTKSSSTMYSSVINNIKKIAHFHSSHVWAQLNLVVRKGNGVISPMKWILNIAGSEPQKNASRLPPSRLFMILLLLKIQLTLLLTRCSPSYWHCVHWFFKGLVFFFCLAR